MFFFSIKAHLIIFQNNDTTAGLGQLIGDIAAEDAVLVKVWSLCDALT